MPSLVRRRVTQPRTTTHMNLYANRACAQTRTSARRSHEPSEAITITVFYGIFVKFIDSLCVSAVCCSVHAVVVVFCASTEASAP